MANEWVSAKEAGAVIRAAREHRSLTQDQVADRLNVDKSYISKLEGGAHHAGRSKYFPQLVEVLALPEEDVRLLNPSAVFATQPPPRPSGQRGPIPPIVDPLELPLEIPEELQIMIDNNVQHFPELANEKTLRALVAPRLFTGRSDGPQTEEQWFDYFMMNRRWLPK